MTDKQYRRTKKRIERFIRRWHGPLGLKWWRVTYDYIVLDFKANGQLAPDTAAVAHVAWEYREATISWNVPRCMDLDDAVLEEVVVHEMMHIFLREVRSEDNDWLQHEEHAATSLARAFLWVRGGMK